AEGLAADEGAGDAAVEIEVADAEVAAGAVKMRRRARIDAAREAIGAKQGEADGVVEVGGVDDREDGAEDLLAEEAMPGADAVEDMRRDQPTGGGRAEQKPALGLADLDVLRDLRGRVVVDDRRDVDAGIGGGAGAEVAGGFDEAGDELVAHGGQDDDAAGG